MNSKQEARIINKTYMGAKNRIKIDGKYYYLYFALLRTGKNFKNVLPFNKDESSEVKIILDNKSDVCLGYGTKRVIKLFHDEQERIKYFK